jgi:hypothetical protein
MTDVQIQEFNAKLAATDEQPTVRSYLRQLNKAIFKQPIEDFVDDLLDLVIRNECCIPHDRLMKYGVLTGTSASSDVLRMLDQYGFKVDRDFTGTFLESSGGRPAKVYHLTPKAFEKCLMRSKNTDRYADFYILLRKCLVSYDRYRLAREQHKSATLMDRNGKLEQMLHDLGVKTDSVLGEIKHVRTENAGMKIDLQEMKGQAVTLLDGVATINRHLGAVAGAAHSLSAELEASNERTVAVAADVALPPDDAAKSDSIVAKAALPLLQSFSRSTPPSTWCCARRPRASSPRCAGTAASIPACARSCISATSQTASTCGTACARRWVTVSRRSAGEHHLHAQARHDRGRRRRRRQRAERAPQRAEDAGTRARAWADEQLLTVDTAEAAATHVLTIVEETTTVKKTTTIELKGAELDAAVLALFD